jgi:hypothetical protein
MTVLQQRWYMKKQVGGLFLAIGFGLASINAARAMSSLISLAEEPLWPTSTSPNGDVLYNVTAVGRGGSGLLQVTLTASNLPPGVTVTFSPSVLKFTGNALVGQSATMTVHCQGLVPLDCYPFTITATAQRESITITNVVTYTPEYVATRPVTLYLDNQGSGNLRVRGLGATGGVYLIQSSPSLGQSEQSWTSLGQTTADGNGRFVFFTTQATNGAPRFYRALTVSLPMGH